MWKTVIWPAFSMWIEFHTDYGMVPLGAMGNEGDNFQLMYTVKWLKQNDLAIGIMRNTMAGNTMAQPLQGGQYVSCWLEDPLEVVLFVSTVEGSVY